MLFMREHTSSRISGCPQNHHGTEFSSIRTGALWVGYVHDEAQNGSNILPGCRLRPFAKEARRQFAGHPKSHLFDAGLFRSGGPVKAIHKEVLRSLLLWLCLATGRRMTIRNGGSITLAVTMVEVGKSFWAAYIRTCRLASTEVGHADEIPDAEIASDRSCPTVGPGCLFARRFLA